VLFCQRHRVSPQNNEIVGASIVSYRLRFSGIPATAKE
jgi:hypothetical protein